MLVMVKSFGRHHTPPPHPIPPPPSRKIAGSMHAHIKQMAAERLSGLLTCLQEGEDHCQLKTISHCSVFLLVQKGQWISTRNKGIGYPGKMSDCQNIGARNHLL